jgi:hypothetical protein
MKVLRGQQLVGLKRVYLLVMSTHTHHTILYPKVGFLFDTSQALPGMESVLSVIKARLGTFWTTLVRGGYIWCNYMS